MSRALFRQGLASGAACLVACAALIGAGVAAAATSLPAVKFKVLPVKTVPDLAAFSEALSPNGKLLYVVYSGGVLSTGGASVVVYNLKDPKAAPKVITDANVPISDAEAVALAPNAKHLYIAAPGGTDPVLVADVGGSGPKNNTVVSGIADSYKKVTAGLSVAVAPNGKTIYIGGIYDHGADHPAIGILAAKLKSATKGAVKSLDKTGVLGLPTALTIAPNGKSLYASDLFGPAAELATSGIHMKSAHALPEIEGVYGLGISPDGSKLYGGGLGAAIDAVFVSKPTFETYALSGATAQVRAQELSSSSSITDVVIAHSGTVGYATTYKQEEVHSGGTTKTVEVGGVDKLTIPGPKKHKSR